MDNSLHLIAGTYKIIGQIGSGGGGIAYLAEHIRLEKKVVLKADKRTLSTKPEVLRYEVDALKNLSHTYIPQVYDFIEENGIVYTVMDYIDGESFDKPLKRGERFSQAQVIAWACQLSDALIYLHSRPPHGILHADIKPSNIMLTPQGDVRLIDFNIALALGEEGAIAVGRSFGYASPEHYGLDYSSGNVTQGINTDVVTDISENSASDVETGLESKPQPISSSGSSSKKTIMLNVRSDIYSMGATLYHLVTGEKPAISTGEVKALRDFDVPLSEAFIYIIERCMERDSARRFQTANDLREALVNIHKLDGRWKQHRLKVVVAASVLSAAFVAFSVTAVFGFQRLGFEKIETYNHYVLAIAADDSAYEQAIALFPENPDAYREQALKLCQAGNYEEGIRYVKTVMAKLSAFAYNEAEIKQIGNIDYILGNAYFETEDYPNALTAYEAAVKANPANPEMYRDYAIALARSGSIDRAEELLAEIRGLDMAVDSVNLLRGEIAYAKDNDSEAVALFRDVIRDTGDAYLKSRAYLICDKAYRRMPDSLEEDIALLREAVRDLPSNYALVPKERLADALVRGGSYGEAVALFEELLQSGGIGYQTRQNVGVLYQQTGDYQKAREIYAELMREYPDDYRPPLRLAYLVLERQSRLANESRDYAEAVGFYEQAQKLYKTDDMEMARLESLIAELRRNGWI
jgi:serine/threonine-protein kinase